MNARTQWGLVLAARERLRELDSAISAKALRSELADQSSEDETADALLARMRGSKDATASSEVSARPNASTSSLPGKA